MKTLLFLLTATFFTALKLNAQIYTAPGTGNIGIKTTSPATSLQIGNTNDGQNHNLLMPGMYNFEQLRLGQLGNGASGLELVNHIDISNSYGIKFVANSDEVAGLQIKYSPYASSYGSLSYTTGIFMGLDGYVGIGTTATGTCRLAVDGKIGAREIKVTLGSFADYVFDKTYKLRSLYDLDKFIQMNKHLPGIPTAKEVEENGGVELGKMNVKLLEKVEELTLYVIQLKKENDGIKKQLKKVLNKK